MSIKTAETPVAARRPYRVVRAALQKARADFQTMHATHEAACAKIRRHDEYRDKKVLFRDKAVAAGVIDRDDDLADEYRIPARVKIDPVLQETFHNQHYVIEALEIEEATYSSLEKGLEFIAEANANA